jgi:ribose/xylose/arabinose/galactoside ABC-type transport system permease subunit
VCEQWKVPSFIVTLGMLTGFGRFIFVKLFGIGDNFKPIVIGTVIVLAVVLDAYRDRYLRRLESR